MPTILQFRRGTTTQNDTYTGLPGEITIDTTLNTVRLHDGSTVGGNVIGQTGQTGYTGSVGGVGYTGSVGVGYTGSAGLDGDKYHTTSTSTLNLSTYALNDTITLTTVDLNLDYSAQQTILIASAATPTNHIHAKVLTYDGGTGVLTATVTNIVDAVNSSESSWEVNLDGAVGIVGYTGSVGTFAGVRVTTISDGTSITVDVDTTDLAKQINTQSAGTLTINAPTGTPNDAQKFILKINSTNIQTYSFNAIFVGSTDLALPTATSGSGKTDYLGFIYDTDASKWEFVGKIFGF